MTTGQDMVFNQAGYQGSTMFAILPQYFRHTVKPVLSRHSKIDKTNVLKTNGSLMTVESNTFDLH